VPALILTGDKPFEGLPKREGFFVSGHQQGGFTMGLTNKTQRSLQ